MKKLIIALAALSVSVAAYGQGSFVFNNRIGTEVTARFILPGDTDGSSIGSPDWTVQLLGGAPGSTLQPLTPPSTGFRGPAGSNTAGYVTGITPTVPGVGAGETASVLVRVLGPGGISVDFGPYTVAGLGGVPAGGGAPLTPPNLALGTTALVVPEPATWALGALGLAALMAIRRRK